MRKTILRVPLVKPSRRRRVNGKRFRRVFRLNLARPGNWQRARDYLTGEYKRRAREVLWSGPLCKLIGR